MLTLSATPLQTLPLSLEVVLVAQTASVSELLAGHGAGVIEVMQVYPETRPRFRP